MILYNAGISLLEFGIKVAGLWRPKERLRAEGIKKPIYVKPEDKIFWVHAASVGEFEQGRPIIEYVREHCPEYKILLSFYSSSGYELRKNYKGADYVCYFPADKPCEVRRFLDAAHPSIAVFIKYEFWLNTLFELKRRGVRTFVVSAIFRPGSKFFKPWGGAWRRALTTYETIFVQNESSRALLEGIGVRNVVIAGDTRFDRVFQVTQTPFDNEIVTKFCNGSSRVLVAGSIWGPDEDLLVRLAADNPDIKFIIAPHEMDQARIERLASQFPGGACRFSRPCPDMEKKQALIIDTIGLLSYIYRYASWAYVGGGFGAGIHNTVEPASYGLPVAFGPKYRKFSEAVTMCRLGIATSVSCYEELSKWFEALSEDEGLRQSVCSAASDYTQSQLGATKIIMDKIIGKSAYMTRIFENAISDYHKTDNVDAESVSPYKKGSFEDELYQKNWIDTVQWHLEDIIRDPALDPVRALAIKRRIDRSNQDRTDLVEKIDSYFLNEYREVAVLPDATINTESPAWAIDRLSILALKIYHMKEQVARTEAGEEHVEKCRMKLETLLQQQEDLSLAIDQLLEDIAAGRKYMKVYKQMKMYNDTSTNPILYAKK